MRRTEQNWAEIRPGKVEFKVVGHVRSRLPEAARDRRRRRLLKVDAAVLRDMIAKTIFSVSLDETRQHLAGVLFESDGDDRAHGVHRRAPAVEGGAAAGGRAEAGDRRADSAQGDRRDAARDRDARGADRRSASTTGNFVLKADDVGISVKLIDGQFPPYDQVIPKDNDRAFVVSRLAFLDALKRVAIMSSDKTFGVKLARREGEAARRDRQPRPGRGARKRSTSATRGRRSRSASTPATSSTCSPRSRRPRCASSCRASWIPAVVRPADGSDYVCVVMPMRL